MPIESSGLLPPSGLRAHGVDMLMRCSARRVARDAHARERGSRGYKNDYGKVLGNDLFEFARAGF